MTPAATKTHGDTAAAGVSQPMRDGHPLEPSARKVDSIGYRFNFSFPGLRPGRFRGLVFAALIGAFLGCAHAQDLREGEKFSARGCFAQFSGSELVIGNAHFRRAWKVDRGRLYATSFFDLDRSREWIDVPSRYPSPAPPQDAGDGRAVLRGATGKFGPTEADSLRLELEDVTPTATVDYEFQVFPEASGTRMWVRLKTHAGSLAQKPTEEPVLPTDNKALPQDDALEHLGIAKAHLRLTQVRLLDRTDEHNELVFEDEWLLQPNEASQQTQGNIFVIEDTLTGDGLVFLKEAPQPEMRPIRTKYDAWFSGSGANLEKHKEPLPGGFASISLYGSGFAGSGRGYPFTLLTYHGSKPGQIAALQHYQRQIRQYDPDRDGKLLSNTWGDRSADRKLNENFIREEIDAGSKLGVDIVQIDEGWQTGKAMGMVGVSGVWNKYWETDPHFWNHDPKRFPNGLLPVAQYAHTKGVKLGLWFAPDSNADFINWQKDARQILSWNRDQHIDAFKLDSVKITSKQGEENYHALADTVLKDSDGHILLDLDVTAETRQGYFGNIAAGPLFVENRYTDMHRYWPHQTLRNFWKLSHYVDPLRLRMEFLNSDRNAAMYEGDPLAPIRYRPSCLFAMTMFASPLAWFENSGLSQAYIADMAPMIAQWKKEREAIYRGTILPIGEAPDGIAWSGFASVAEGQRGGYLLLFRELNAQATWLAPGSLFAYGKYRIHMLGGEGTITAVKDGFLVSVPEPLGFAWAKVEAVD